MGRHSSRRSRSRSYSSDRHHHRRDDSYSRSRHHRHHSSDRDRSESREHRRHRSERSRSSRRRSRDAHSHSRRRDRSSSYEQSPKRVEVEKTEQSAAPKSQPLPVEDTSQFILDLNNPSTKRRAFRFDERGREVNEFGEVIETPIIKPMATLKINRKQQQKSQINP